MARETLPLFKKQIKQGGPITLTDNNIERYFMTIKEAAQLVIQSVALAEGGEVFLLDMGSPVKIFDLAKQMINLKGLTLKDDDNPNGDIEISISGLRSGEKLYEELLINAEAEKTNHHPDMIVGWCKVVVTFTSHDKGGVTEQCIMMAKKSDSVY